MPTNCSRAFCLVLGAGLLVGCGGGGVDSAPDPARTYAEMRKQQTPEKLIEQGKGFAALGDTTRAEQYFSAALNAGGDEAVITPLVVSVCVRDGRYELAIEYARRYTQKHPNDVRMRYLLGTLYGAIGDVAHARSELEFVVTNKPDAAEPHWALGKLLHDEGKEPTLAEGQFKEYLRLAPTGSHAEEAHGLLTKEVQ
jgi:tetratricopeptide (TPR) repeat protein